MSGRGLASRDRRVVIFLRALARGDNLVFAAAHADVTISAVSRLRKKDPQFAAMWEGCVALGRAQGRLKEARRT